LTFYYFNHQTPLAMAILCPHQGIVFISMKKLNKWLSILFVIAVVVTAVITVSQLNNKPVKVKVPEFTALALQGKTIFDKNCAACHGSNAAGTNQGPPLVNKIYNPGHHGNDAFYRAVKNGAPSHHWNFGNMPPVNGVGEQQVGLVIHYVRELQEANGIFYQKHMMQ